MDTTEQLPFHFSLSCTGERNGNPLQCSCLENPRDGGAWWAAVYGVAQSRTQQQPPIAHNPLGKKWKDNKKNLANSPITSSSNMKSRTLAKLWWSGSNLKHDLANFFYKRPNSQYLAFVSNKVSVAFIQHFLL